MARKTHTDTTDVVTEAAVTEVLARQEVLEWDYQAEVIGLRERFERRIVSILEARANTALDILGD